MGISIEKIYIGIDLQFITCPLPRPIKAFLKEDKGLYLIVVNSNISLEQQKKALEHEIRHLTMDDFRSDDDIRDIERRCDQ